MTIRDPHPYKLARLAGVSDPDSESSPGALWLLIVHDLVAEVETAVANGEDRSDAIHEVADSAVPVYTGERWRVFADLGAWDVDIDDYKCGCYAMTEQAGIALYEVARTLLAACLDEVDA